MLKNITIFSFTKSDDIIFLFVISCNLFDRDSLFLYFLSICVWQSTLGVRFENG